MDKLKPVPLYIQLKDELIKRIEDGLWEIEQQIPTEYELMQEFNLGRETVRKAISMLVQKGYLYKKRGIGTFVESNKPFISMEPLISLSYFLKTKGYHEKNEVIDSKRIVLNDKLCNETKMYSNNVYYVNRLRHIERKPIALEYAYFIDEKNDAHKHDFSNSITTFLFKNGNIDITKVDQTYIIRKPSSNEIGYLDLNESEKVIEMQRWLYVKDYEDVFFYVRIIINEDMYTYWSH